MTVVGVGQETTASILAGSVATPLALMMAQIRDLSLRKLALGELDVPLIFGQQRQNQTKMIEMLLKRLAVNKDVIKENNSTPAEARPESVVHGSLESARCTKKSKGDDLEFIVAHMGGKRRLVLFTFL